MNGHFRHRNANESEYEEIGPPKHRPGAFLKRYFEREWDMFDLKIVILQFLTDLVQTLHKHSLPYTD